MRTAPRWGMRRQQFTSTALALALVLVACAPGARTAEPTTLHVLMTDDWVTPPYIAAVRDFERAHPGVSVATDKTPIRVMRDTVSADIAENNSPDVVQYHAFAAGAQGLAQPVDDLWQRWLQTSEFLPGAVEDVSWAGHRYGVPLDTNALVLMYNADELARAQLAPPTSTTFADLERMAAALSNGSQRAFSFPTSDWWDYGWIRANGGELLSVGEDGKPTFTLNSPAVVEAVAFLADLVNKTYAFPPRSAASSSGDALALFTAGNAAMYASGSWDLPSLRAKGQDTYHVAPMPHGATGQTEGTVLGGSSLFIPKGSRHRDLAFAFMLTLTSDRYALRLATEQGRLPARPRVFGDPALQDPDLRTFARQLATAHPYLIEAFPQAQAAFATALDQAVRQHQPPATALAAAQAKATASLTGPP